MVFIKRWVRLEERTNYKWLADAFYVNSMLTSVSSIAIKQLRVSKDKNVNTLAS